MIRYCDDGSSVCRQRVKHLKTLEKTDINNAVPNLYTMVYWAELGKFKKALKQLKKATTKTVFTDYNWPRFFLIDKVLQAYGYSNSQAKTAATIGIFMGNDKEPIVKFLGLCKLQSKKDSKWFEPCIELGNIMETYSSMVLSTFIGFAVQRDLLALDKNREVDYQNVLHRRDVFHQFRLRAGNRISYAGISKDADFDQIPEIFFNDLEKFGERVALQHALDRLIEED